MLMNKSQKNHRIPNAKSRAITKVHDLLGQPSYMPQSAISNEQPQYMFMSRIMRAPAFCLHMLKAKALISCVVTVQLISPFVFATQIIQSFLLNRKFQATGHLLCFCVGHGPHPEDRFFQTLPKCSLIITK